MKRPLYVDEVLGEYAQMLNNSPDELPEGSRPHFLQVAEEQGFSISEILSTGVNNHEGCLLPHEIEEIQSLGKLGEGRMAHLESCADCFAMVSALGGNNSATADPWTGHCVAEEAKSHDQAARAFAAVPWVDSH